MSFWASGAWRAALRFASGTCAALLLVAVLSGIATPAIAQSAASFDHLTTSFPLTGAHELVRCETCHIKAIFKGTPRDCEGCHVQNNQRGALAKPFNHVQTSATCDTCHTMAGFAGTRFNHVTVAPGSCASCHNGNRAAGKPTGHIATTLSCDQCHVTSAFAPARRFDHQALGGNYTTCASCHDGRVATGRPANHIVTPDPTKCGTCHVASTQNGFTTFAGGQMDHSGIANGCATCHGPTVTPNSFAGISNIVVMPPTSPAGPNSHIPSATTCETCHLATVPGGLIAANAPRNPPGSGFAFPAPTAVQIHSGVTSGCSNCHEASAVWMGVNAYPISPTTVVLDALYTGFQTRPRAAAGTFNVADAAHPTTGDCSQCHFSTLAFTAKDKPANHIPTSATAQCTACHTSTDFSVMPTLANIHANAPSTTSNCAQCHGAAAPSFAIPSANFSIVGLPGNHIPNTSSCETCHVGAGSSIAATPVGNGAKFSGSLMNHTGITNNCMNCHGPTITGSSFIGVSRIVVMPPTSPMGASSHIPSSTTCESCHLASLPAGYIAPVATRSAPGSAFATPAPTTAQIHAGVTSGCSSCHEASSVWMGMTAYPIAPTVKTTGAQYTGFQTRPRAAAGTFNVADAAHPSAGDCSQCHSSTDFFSAQDKPANHIPTSPTAQCSACHTSTDFSVIPTLANIHANAPSTTGNCAQCHGAAAASFAIPAANFSIVGLPGNHIPTTNSCETCHVGAGSSIAATPVGNGAKFIGSLMNHTGIASNCVACHGPTITGSSFIGVSRIVVMPPTSPVGPSSHIPSSTTCESCHVASIPAGSIPAAATRSAPGSAFATPAPTSAQIHAGVTGGCASCHEASFVWMGVSAYPIAPTTLTAGAQYTGFQTRPRAAAGTFNVADAAHPAAGDCSQCHSNTSFFSAQDKPPNHIPTAPGVQCTACHTSADFSVMPTLANIHANAPSTTGNCAQCHGAAAPSFAIPAANFSIVGLPGNHVPTSGSCETCHVGAGSSIAATPVGNGAKFSGSLMSHAGITSNCAACHGSTITGSSFVGVSRIIVMPPTSPVGPSSHIPSSTACETCHLASTPPGLIAATATRAVPGSAFATPAPTTAQIHVGVTGGCASCHETSFVWMGVSAYPIAPTTLTAGAQYTGFQTRPRAAAGTFNVADAAHPATGDCSQCHGNTNFFSAQDKPANHIPTAPAAQCTACHTSSDYSVIPTLANIHANVPSTTSNCAQCHGAASASFAIPSANFSIVGLPGNHMPTTTSCEACHVGAGSSITATPVGNGAKFSGSLMSHTGITNNCAACHGPTITGTSFIGVSRIVVMPPSSPAGASSHIPSSTTCETCHLASTPSGLIAAAATRSVPGSAFATPAPTTTQIHTGITGGCSSCHEASYVWMGMTAYPIAPTVKTTGAQYTGFQTRPRAAAGTFNVADAAHPATGDCSQCHSGTNFFSAQDKPANHIPTSATAQCTACHTSTDFSVMPTLANIHANAPSTTSNCAQCHGAAAPSFAIPSANFSIVGLPGNHIPTSSSCEACHVGAGSSITATPVGNGAKFSGSLMSHTGITNNCVVCHGPTITGSSFAGVTRIVVMPPTSPVGASSHIPSSTTCESCHLATTPSGLIPGVATKSAPGSAFATPAPTTTQIHTGITGGCSSCHEASYVWMGMTAYPIAPTVKTTGAQYTGFQTRPRAAAGTFNVADAAHPATGDCSQCHSGTNFFSAQDKPANHIPTSATAQCTACHTSTDFSVMPTLANIHANAPSTTSNCAQCHGAAAPSFAIPSANFSIVGLPGNHIPTSSSCEACHVGAGSSITATPVGNGAKFSGSLMSHAGITNNCAACHGPAITGSSFTGVSRIVVMPSTSPVGASSHIPSSTTCETCHLATTPAGLIPAVATRTAPGSAFATPAPTTAQIHNGITSGCSSCHESSYVWMGMTAYPISPTTVVANAQYTGFQTRPRAAAGTFNVADAGHPAAGDCSQCHSGTNYFTGQTKPTGHIPTLLSSCSTCHIVAGDFSVAGLTTNLATLHTGVTSGCITCHSGGSGAGPFAGCTTQAACTSPPPLTYQPKTTPLAAGGSPTAPSTATHIPVIGIACEKCHSATVFTSFAGMNMKGNTTAHTAVAAATCESCHENQYQWNGVTIKTPGSANHQGRTAGQDCISSGCHKKSYSQFVTEARVRPVLRSAVNSANPRLLPDGSFAPSGASGPLSFNHQGVLPGQCQTCHNGQAAKGQPTKHLVTRASCDTCHRTTAWTPAQFSHAGVLPGQCQTCHNGASATAKSSGHFVTARSCDACHRTIGWVPTGYSHLSPLYRAQPDKPQCVNCHITNGELIPRQLRGGPRPKPVPAT